MLCLFFSLLVAAEIQNLANIELSIKELKQNIEENYILLANNMKKTSDISRDISIVVSRTHRAIDRMNEAVDVSVYSLFTLEVKRRYNLVSSGLKKTESNYAKNPFTLNIQKRLDHFSVKQAHDSLFQSSFDSVEASLENVKNQLRISYDFTYIQCSIGFFAVCLIALLSLVARAHKRHYL